MRYLPSGAQGTLTFSAVYGSPPTPYVTVGAVYDWSDTPGRAQVQQVQPDGKVQLRDVDGGVLFWSNAAALAELGVLTEVQPGQRWLPDEGGSPIVIVKPLSKDAWTARFEAYSGIEQTISDAKIRYAYHKHLPKTPTPKSPWPHRCTKCGEGALILFQTIECSNSRCAHYRGGSP